MAILDQYGNAISSRTFLKAAENGGGRVPSVPLRVLDPLKKLITYRDWLTTSFLSDKLYANFGVVEGVICQKAMFAVGNAWLPVFFGADEEWGKEARRWLIEEWYPTCDIRGTNYDFVTNLYQQSVAIDRAGDTIKMLSESDNGWPMVQDIPNRQIGQWERFSAADQVLKDGDYKGLIMRNGVIMTRNERPMAYRKLGETNGEFEDLAANYVVHTFEPKWNDQARGFPIFSSCIEDFRVIAQSDEWEQQAGLIASAIGLLEYNETGEGDTSEDDPLSLQSNDGTPDGMEVKTMYGGLIRYMKASSGQKLEQHINNRPGADWESFQDRTYRKCLAAANWPYSWGWKPGEANGTSQRTENTKARIAVTDRQSLLEPCARRQVGYAISVAIKNGMLPAYPGQDKGGFLKWGFTKPPRISIDEGRDRQQRREDSKFGLVLDSTIVEEDGNTTYQEFCQKRARDVITRKKAQLAEEEASGMKIEDREMKMFTPNDMGGEATVSETDDPDGDDAEDEPDVGIENTKRQMDAYGVGVRSGSITPNNEDEATFRAQLGLPKINANVKKAWEEDGGVRRPITLVGKDGLLGEPKQSEDDEI